MINAFYSGASGLKVQQTSIDVRANNIANINTTAYKTQDTDFSEVLYTNIFRTGLKNGNGAYVSQITKSVNQGMFDDTERVLDAAIAGDGFFAVADKAGNISYTRDGNFNLSPVEGGLALITADGYSVLDGNKNPIIYKGAADEIIYTASGDTNNNQSQVNIGVFSFENPYALAASGNNKFTATNAAGDITLNTQAVIMQGRLERSTVDLSEEMTKLIESQRAYQASAKMVQTADEIESWANNLR